VADFLDEVTEELWGFLAACSSDAETRTVVQAKDRDELLALFRQFVQLRADVADEFSTSGLVVDASEDTLDDLAEAVLLGGRTAVYEILSGRRPLPPRESWGRLRQIVHIVADVFNARFGEEIFGALDD
jgi:hypothetical protein